jgi:hypothetical protein
LIEFDQPNESLPNWSRSEEPYAKLNASRLIRCCLRVPAPNVPSVCWIEKHLRSIGFRLSLAPGGILQHLLSLFFAPLIPGFDLLLSENACCEHQ